MKPFNIRVRYGSGEVTLTILPEEKGNFKIVYYGGILGGIKKVNKEWDLIPLEEVAGGDLPLYEPKHGQERVDIELTDHMVDRIGEEIDLNLEGDGR